MLTELFELYLLEYGYLFIVNKISTVTVFLIEVF